MDPMAFVPSHFPDFPFTPLVLLPEIRFDRNCGYFSPVKSGFAGAGIVIGALFLILFVIYRRRWHRRLRDRLASDGIRPRKLPGLLRN